MGPQVAETRDAEIVLAGPRNVRPTPRTDAGAVVSSIAEDAAEVGWPETIRTLLGFVRPYRGPTRHRDGCAASAGSSRSSASA